MTGSPPTEPPSDSVQKITVLELVAASGGGGMFTLVLGEQLCCSGCGRTSTRWDIPAGDIVPGQRRVDNAQDDHDGPGGHDPGE